MNPDGLNSIGSGINPSIVQVPAPNLLREAATTRRIAEAEETLGKLGKQIQGLEVQVTDTLAKIENLREDSKRLNKSAEETEDKTKDLQAANRDNHTLIMVAVYILIGMLVAVVIAATVFEIQFIDSNNQKNVNILEQIYQNTRKS